MSEDLNDYRMKWGKWKGERICDVPDSYWLWLRKQGLSGDPQVRQWLQQNKARLDALVKDDWK